MLMVLIALTQYRDKFEKKIVSMYEPAQLHFARASLTPLVYVCFTLMMLMQQSLSSFLLATIYQLAYISFYYDESFQALKGQRLPEITIL
jgi:hypothetical protein